MATKSKVNLNDVLSQLSVLTKLVTEALAEGNELTENSPQVSEVVAPKKRGRPRKKKESTSPPQQIANNETFVAARKVDMTTEKNLGNKQSMEGRGKTIKFVGDGLHKNESVKKNPSLGTSGEAREASVRPKATKVTLQCAFCGRNETISSALAPPKVGGEQSKFRCNQCCRG